MTAGLPGTGLGGLFYVLLVVLMPARELYLTVRGQSSASRWRNVVVHVALTAGILGALAGFAWSMSAGLTFLVDCGLVAAWLRPAALEALTVTSRTATLVALSLIGLAMAATAVARRFVTADGPSGPSRVPSRPSRVSAATPPGELA
jgi:hypothetical protein